MNLAIDNPIPTNAVHSLARLIASVVTWVFLLQTNSLAGQPTSLPKEPSIRSLIIDNQFMTTTVNDQVLISKEPPSRQGSVILARFLPNSDPRQVMIGPAYTQPQAWVYLPMVNRGSQKRQLVVDLDHNRCDTLEAFLLSVNKPPIYLGKLFRGLPLAKRAMPLRTYALPFELAPYAAAGLLLHSRRTTGIHELSIALSTQTQFIIKHNEEQFMRLAALSSAFFFAFTVCALGLLFNHQLLVYFGLYVLAIGLGQLNYNYYFDSFPFPSLLGLNANSVGLFIIYLSNCLFLLFGVAYLENLALYSRWHRYTLFGLTVANLIPLALLVWPLTPLTNRLVTEASLLLTTLNIVFLFYISIVGFIRKREVYLLLTAALVFLPLLYRAYTFDKPVLVYNYFQPFYYLILFGFLMVCLLRRELTSRALTQQTIRLVETTLEQLRQAEIEQIGRNLHDQLGNTLASALGYLTMKEPHVVLAQQMLINAINETRVISHNLVKDNDRPLIEKLEDLAERFNDFSSISFTYNDFTEQQINQLTPLKQQSIYLIVQEVLSNSIKHSQAQEVVIQTFLSEGLVRVSIDDDGIGYVSSEQIPGIGIRNMYKRAELANLRLVIDGGLGGTSVSVETQLTG